MLNKISSLSLYSGVNQHIFSSFFATPLPHFRVVCRTLEWVQYLLFFRSLDCRQYTLNFEGSNFCKLWNVISLKFLCCSCFVLPTSFRLWVHPCCTLLILHLYFHFSKPKKVLCFIFILS